MEKEFNEWSYIKRANAVEPDWHIEHTTDGCYHSTVNNSKEKKKYIKVSLSKNAIGHLLQGKHIALLFLTDGSECEGMIDIELVDGGTKFEVSKELNELIVGI